MMPCPTLAVALPLALFLVACETGGRPPAPSAGAAAAAPAANPIPIEEQVKALAAQSRPGAKHAELGPLAGSWDVVLSDVGADQKEIERCRGGATLAWILGGRFLHWDVAVDFNGVEGTTTGYLGFDSRLDEYELLMISDLAQGMAVAHGTGDLAAQGLVFTVEQLDPRSGARARSRSRLRLLAPDHFTLQQLEPDSPGAGAGGGEHATRVWHYRRAHATAR
jgi:hypothetical protein